MTRSVGRPKGLPKTGGRQPGTKNRDIAEKEAAIAASGLTPLDYLLSLVRNPEKDESIRADAAKAAAPYCHARLVSTQNSHQVTMTVEEILQRISGLPGQK
jgi:hypothetical protein